MRRLLTVTIIIAVLSLGLAPVVMAEHPTEHPTKAEHPEAAEKAEGDVATCGSCGATKTARSSGIEDVEKAEGSIEHPTKS